MVEGYNGEEKRKYPRLVASFPSGVTLHEVTTLQNVDRPCQTFTKNISAGGLALSLDRLQKETVDGLLTGEIAMYVDIDLPVMTGPVRVLARAAWMKDETQIDRTSSGIVVGLRFVDISEWDRSRIDTYVTKALTREE